MGNGVGRLPLVARAVHGDHLAGAVHALKLAAHEVLFLLLFVFLFVVFSMSGMTKTEQSKKVFPTS